MLRWSFWFLSDADMARAAGDGLCVCDMTLSRARHWIDGLAIQLLLCLVPRLAWGTCLSAAATLAAQ